LADPIRNLLTVTASDLTHQNRLFAIAFAPMQSYNFQKLTGGISMKRTVVVFSSKYGSTKQYAQWIAQELCCDLFERKEISTNKLEHYDIIIYGGGLYAGGLNGSKLIIKSFEQIKEKTLVVFTCGLADPEDETTIYNIKNALRKVFSPEMEKKIMLFHLRGAMDYSKLSVPHKIMMEMLFKSVSRKVPESLTNEDKAFLDTYGKAVNFVDKGSLDPLLTYVKKS
jgi:menaquinone-dependent protoporphyrinogen IX oxidase